MVFLGGVTHAEIAALRFLSKKVLPCSVASAVPCPLPVCSCVWSAERSPPTKKPWEREAV